MADIEDFNKYLALGKILPNSWGTGTQAKTSFQSIKYSLRDDKLLKVNFMMIVNMPNNTKFAFEMKNRYTDEAMALIRSSLEDLKEKFKDVTEGKTVKFNIIQNSVNEGIEFLSTGQYRPSKHGYFRLECLIEID